MTRPIQIALLGLALVGLACAASSTTGGALPTVSFSTATPGGRISISLLTPTITVPGSNLKTTPIGPVATQTAAYATSVAQTATAAFPTPTIPGILSPAALCPEPPDTNPTLPAAAPAFGRYAEIIVQYLSAGGPPTILEATLRAWGAVAEFGGLVRADRDFTADGVPEVLVLVLDPDHVEDRPRPGQLLIFGCEERAYRLLYQSGYALDQGAPVIHSADDINSDYVNDLVYSIETCGTQVCYREVVAVGWKLALGNFDNLLAQEVIEALAEVVVSDVDEDGIIEISVTSGIIDNPAAGPQRQVTTIYRWDGTFFVVGEVIRSPVEYRIHLIHDGDAALRATDYEAAIDFYREAIDDNRLRSWTYPNEDLHLKAYAQYRIMLAQVLKGSITAAQAAHDRLLNEYLPPTPTPLPEGTEGQPPTATPPFGGEKPGIEFARIADFFWRDFAVNRDLRRACDVVLGYVRATPRAYEVLNSFGFANPTYTAEDMCPYGSGQ